MAAMTNITVAQLALSVDDRAANAAAIAQAVRAAPPGMVVLPELAASGYCFRDAAESRAAAEPLRGPTYQLLHGLAQATGSTIVAGIAEWDDAVYNTALVVDGTGLLGHYRKVHLWAREGQHFRPGSAPPAIVPTAHGRLGVVVCYDLEFPEWTRMAALAGADLVCAPVNWPAGLRPAGERPIEQVTVQAAAAASRVPIAVADRAGPERMGEEIGSDWVGGSIIVGADGYPLTAPALGQATLLTARLDLAAVPTSAGRLSTMHLQTASPSCTGCKGG